MPASAEKALKGLLAEGVSPEDILDKLKAEGFGIEPPSEDESYEAPKEESGAVLAIGIEAADDKSEEKEDEKEDEKEEENSDKRLSAAEKAMKKHGFS